MSGHSKWSTIKRKKGAIDAARSKVFQKLAKELYVAAKSGDPDPANNASLRMVVEKAKAENMPKANIESAIAKAASKGASEDYESVRYEGYGPNGIAIIVEALTDNKNRTAANVRSAFTKGQGNIGTQGCVSFMFDNKGQIIIDKEDCELSADDLMMVALDAGAEDFNEEEESFEILTSPEGFMDVVKALEENKTPTVSAEVTMIPQNYVSLTDETAVKNLNRTLDLLDDDDDVQNVYTNWEEEDELR
jgi:YebC/PmpR family DNA-binding regulatory protein